MEGEQMTKPEDEKLADDLSRQKELLMRAYGTGDDSIIEAALIRVVTVRRMKKSGIFGWKASDV